MSRRVPGTVRTRQTLNKFMEGYLTSPDGHASAPEILLNERALKRPDDLQPYLSRRKNSRLRT